MGCLQSRIQWPSWVDCRWCEPALKLCSLAAGRLGTFKHSNVGFAASVPEWARDVGVSSARGCFTTGATARLQSTATAGSLPANITSETLQSSSCIVRRESDIAHGNWRAGRHGFVQQRRKFRRRDGHLTRIYHHSGAKHNINRYVKILCSTSAFEEYRRYNWSVRKSV